MGNIEVSKMISTASLRMNTLKSLLTDTEPKSDHLSDVGKEIKEIRSCTNCINALCSSHAAPCVNCIDWCFWQSMYGKPDGQSPDTDGWVFAEPKIIIERLVEAYPSHPGQVASICDDLLDRSGALLGEVRRLANELSK